MVAAAAVPIPMGAFLLDSDLKPCALGEIPCPSAGSRASGLENQRI